MTIKRIRNCYGVKPTAPTETNIATKIACRGAGSNCRHTDFQSVALPLSYLGNVCSIGVAHIACQADILLM